MRWPAYPRARRELAEGGEASVVVVRLCSEGWGVVEHTEGREFDGGYSGRDKSGQGDVEKSQGKHGGCREGDEVGREDYWAGGTRYMTTRTRADDEDWGRDWDEGMDKYEVATMLSRRTRTWT